MRQKGVRGGERSHTESGCIEKVRQLKCLQARGRGKGRGWADNDEAEVRVTVVVRYGRRGSQGGWVEQHFPDSTFFLRHCLS